MLSECGSGVFYSLPPKHAWWSAQVLCVQLEEVNVKGEESETVRFYGLPTPVGTKFLKVTRLLLTGPPDAVLSKHLDKRIVAFQETRQHFWSFQPKNWITFHNFTILEIAGSQLYLLLEKVSNKLEIMMGEGQVPLSFMREYRATGHARYLTRCFSQPRQTLSSQITLRRLLRWIDGPLARRWQPYSLLQANCQHFAQDLHQFLLTPGAGELQLFPTDPHGVLDAVKTDAQVMQHAPSQLWQDTRLVLAAIQQNWRVLQHAPLELQKDMRCVMAAVTQDGYVLQNVAPELRNDRNVVLAAVRQNGDALQYASPEMKRNREVVFAAFQQSPDSLQHAAEELRRDREFLLAAVKRRGLALRYAADKLKQDRALVLAAVSQNGQALNYAHKDLRWDPEVLMAAGLQDPVSLLAAWQ